MIGTVETQLNYIPFASIHTEETPYRFRTPHPVKDEQLVQALLKSGQTHPILLEEISLDEYRILDGHRRYDSIAQIRRTGGSWEKIWAHMIPMEILSPLERFRLIKERNFDGENAYGVHERGLFFSRFKQEGLRISDIAMECTMTLHAVEDHIELTAVPPALAEILNQTKIEATFALMLYHRFESWIRSPHYSSALPIANRLLEHAKTDKLTVKTWRFLLDFYWSEGRPFLDGRLNPS